MSFSNNASKVVDNTHPDALFIEKVDLACLALREPSKSFGHYGSGIQAAYRFLSEAHELAPDNHDVAAELEKIRHVMQSSDSGPKTVTATAVTAPGVPAPNSRSEEAEESAMDPSVSARISQRWQSQPTIEVIVCVKQHQLTGLADTIDSLGKQLYSHWKFTVISDLPSPDPVFDRQDVLQWLQTERFSDGIKQVIERSKADWIGVVQAGSRLADKALLLVADYDNLKGRSAKMVYSDEDHIDAAGQHQRPLFKHDSAQEAFDIHADIGQFCFVRRQLLSSCSGVHERLMRGNTDLVSHLADVTGKSALVHIPEILYHRPA